LADLTLFLGGAKSGKTKAALEEACRHPAPRYYLATAEGRDGEMRERIARHQAERGPGWLTMEAPMDPAGAIRSLSGSCPLLLDCLTLWLSNQLFSYREPGERAASEILAKGLELAEASEAYPGPVIMVSNEVGGGIVPMEPISRLFRDLAGSINQLMASRASSVFLVTSGLRLRLK
jgi:adenosylcobinamide kinase/adenosylcobinamide-phosphate guanylyltransferase